MPYHQVAGVMATRRRRRLHKRSDGSGTIEVQQIDSPPIMEPSARSGLRWLIPLCSGILLGAVVCTIARPILDGPSVAQNSADDGLLVTQQLDALFTLVESQLNEDGSQLPSYQKLLDLYLVYDRLYLEQASTDPRTRLAKAYAARRMGHCCQAIGKLEESSECYRHSRDLFASCLQADPDVVDLFSLWLNAHTQIVYVDFEIGDLTSARSEFRAALRGLQESDFVQDFDYHKSLMLEFKSLAQLGIQLKLYAETIQVAERFAHSAKTLKGRSPHDAELAQDVTDAELYLKILSSLLHQQENP